MKPILKLIDYSFRLNGDTAPVHLLDEINLEIYPKEIVGFVGASGSGKSLTALASSRLLYRFSEYEESGQMHLALDDKTQNLLDGDHTQLVSSQLGLVFQQSSVVLNPTQKIGKQLEEKLLLKSTAAPQSRRAEIISLFEEVELSPGERIYEAYPHQLSGGQLQRVLIALAVITRPRLVIADEPLSALDSNTQAQILELIQKLNKTHGISFLLISHDLNVVKELCTRLYIIDGGRIVESGPTEQLFHKPQSPQLQELIALSKRTETMHKVETVNQPLFSIQNLTKSYQGRSILGQKIASKTVSVLHDFNLDIYKGEVLGLMGQSGSGKSTLGRAILRLEEIDSGTIIYQGANIFGFSPLELKKFRKECQIIFQDPFSTMSPHRTVLQHFEDAASVLGRALDRTRVEEILAIVNLEPLILDRPPSQVSGGQRQRVLIARAIYMKAKFLVCDEILSSLDVAVGSKILSLLNRLVKEYGLTILFISHDKAVLDQICTRIIVLDTLTD